MRGVPAALCVAGAIPLRLCLRIRANTLPGARSGMSLRGCTPVHLRRPDSVLIRLRTNGEALIDSGDFEPAENQQAAERGGFGGRADLQAAPPPCAFTSRGAPSLRRKHSEPLGRVAHPAKIA